MRVIFHERERERTIHWNISLHLLRTRVIVRVFLLIRTSLDCLQNYNWVCEQLDYTSSRLLWSSNYSILCKILFFQTVLPKQMQFFKNFQLSFKVGEWLSTLVDMWKAVFVQNHLWIQAGATFPHTMNLSKQVRL